MSEVEPKMILRESGTRTMLVNPLLRAAGWDLNDRTQVRFEVPVEGYAVEPCDGITDFSFYDSSANVLAILETKRFRRDAREGQEQLRIYLDQVGERQGFMPFGFMSNGRKTYFWDYGFANPRMVAGFFAREDLDRLLFLRQNRSPIESAPINTTIVDRPYQERAVRRIAEAFASGKRRALLVMATGTGKTRATMALIDLFLRTHQAQRVLFLADRDALVEQALTEGFKAHLPHEPRDRIYTWNVDKTKRLFVATEQTLSLCYQDFTPSFFDLIIFDESHRSIFNRFSDVMEYFDARMIGLTATPASFIDRDTYRVFDCEDTTPTFLYDYATAVNEKHLVDFSLYQAQTGFQRAGIRGVDLSEEDRSSLIAQGLDPDSIDYTGTDIEVQVSNKDTLRKQWEEIMENCLKDQSGQLPGKTIVFAMTKAHAERIRETFEQMYPQHLGLIQVITSSTERVRDGTWGDGLITKFKKNDLPRLAISVDMLDTGLNVPEVVNLVFMKPVQSHIKLWQMIGRGTRNDEACRYRDRLPNGKKTEFKIIDFWQNDFNRQPDTWKPQDIPVLVSIFNTRLRLLETLQFTPNASGDARHQTIADLRAMIARIPTESFPIQKVLTEVEEAWADSFWKIITREKIEFLRLKVAPLLRFTAQVDVAAEVFTHKVERLKLQTLRDKPSPDTAQRIAEDVSRLPDYVLQDARCQDSIKLCLSQTLLEASPAQLTQVINDLAPHMRNRRDRVSAFLTLDLPDFIATRGYISLGEGGEQVYVEEYRQRIESRIREIVASSPTLEAIRQGRDVTEVELADLERTLNRELSGGDLQLNASNFHKAYGVKVDSFLGVLRHVLALDTIPDYAAVVRQAFEKHVSAHRYNAEQNRFLRAVEDVFLQNRKLELADLYDPPLTAFGMNAADRFFTTAEMKELIAFANQLAA